jgi:acetyl esterase/lipase
MATPENTKSNYRAKTLESCNKFSADLDKQTACLTGAMGEDLLQYYPLSSVSCEYINDFKTKKLTDACKEGAKAGKSTYRAFYSGVDKAYEQAVKNACAQYKNSDTEWQWCVYGGMGEASKEGFPVHPTTCTNSPTLARQDANQSACIAGSEAGNGILLSYTETGTLTNIDGSTIAGSTDAATGGGGNGQAGAGGATNGGYENGFGSGENPGERLPTSPDDIKQEANNQNPSKPANDFKENLGADKNGAGTAQLQKQPSSAPGLPLAQSGTSQYVDGGGGTQNLEFFHPDDKKRPLIIFVPGGGWREDGGTFQRDFQIRAGKQGFASIRANYRKAANGLYATYNDVNNLLKSVRENANTYNIDPQRIVMWGDSAGGSLTARTAASGTSGLSTAVTWSGPMNAIRDLFTISPESFLIGIDHSTCIDTEWTNQLRPLQEIWRGYEFLAHDPARILSMPLDQQLEVVRRLERSMGPIMIARDGIHKMLDGWEIDVPRARELIVSTRDSLYRIETVVAEMDPSKPISTKPDLLANSSLGTAGSTLHELLPRLAKHAELSSEVQQQVVILTEVDRALQNGFDSPERLAQAISSLAGNQDIRTYLNLQNAGPVNNQQVISLMERVAAGGMSQQDIINAGTPIVRAVLAQSADEFARLTQVKDANGNTILLNNIGTTVQQTGKGKAATGTKYSQEDALALAVTNLTDAEIAELAKTSPIPKEVAAQLGLSEDEQARITNLTQGFDQSSRVIMRNMSLLLDDFEGTSSKQILPIRKINECIDNFKQLSPSLFAHPQTPPMFMANASHERLVPAQDAYEMRDKLQSFGTRAEVLILPGDIHMGYDQRAEEPSFRFIRDITKPEPVRHEPAAATTVPGPRRSGG